jgi:hypothetical protein
MKIIAVDGVPVPQEEPKPISTSKKVKVLQAANEDFEFYPTTHEIMEAMRKDIWKYLRSHKNHYAAGRNDVKNSIKIDTWWDNQKEKEGLYIHSFLDIGAGDGRVLNYFKAQKNYGIEIARAQADDLISKGIFLIGRDYWDVSLIEQEYSLIYSNPPFSVFERWVNKILTECNFRLLYLVMPIRWKNQKEITKELERYEVAVVGEFDFSKASAADREARGKVNLVRVNAGWKKDKLEKYTHQETVENAFDRWVKEYIADFEEKPEWRWEEKHKEALALKQTPIDQLVSDYETEKQNLGEAFRAIGKLDPAIIKLMGQDKASMLEIIRKSIEGLKSKYWRAAFDKLEPVNKRMTHKTRDRIFGEIEEFKILDFNADNIYSIIIWIINNCNIGILDQIGEVFDEMTSKEYIEGYKSNRHWVKSDWRHTDKDWKYEKLPPRWKLGLDYRIVLSTYFRYSYEKYSIVDDFIIICKNLGFPISPSYQPDYQLHSSEQKFYTEDGELAFTMRYYTGNKNAHLKINKKLLMKFNIEVAKIRKWMSDPDDVVEEFNVSKEEAAQMWNSGLALLGAGDVKMLEFKEAI